MRLKKRKETPKMIESPPNEIMNYVSFRNGNVLASKELPQELQPTFEVYKKKFERAKKQRQERIEAISVYQRKEIKE